MLSPVPVATSGPSTGGSAAAQSRSRSTISSRSNRYSPVAGDQYPVPDASPRSVPYSPPRRHASQSCGSITRSMRANTSGAVRWSHESFVIVNAATGTDPAAAAHAAAPPSSRPSNHPASGADSVSFHSFAGRSGVPAASVTTSPCCCAATETAATSSSWPACSRAAVSAPHHARGSCSETGGEVGGCGARPEPTSSPVSASRIWTLVDWVEESMPRTSTVTLLAAGVGSTGSSG